MSGFKAIYCKELKRIFKEPKMIFSLFFLPVILMIGIYGLVGFMTDNMMNDIAEHKSIVIINNMPEEIKGDFKDYEALNQIEYRNDGSSVPDDELQGKIREGEVDLYVSFPKDFMTQIENSSTPDVATYYNPSENYSSKAREDFTAIMENSVYNKLLSERLGGDLSVLDVFTIDAANSGSEIVDEQKASGQMLGMLLPYIIVILLFSSVMSLGVDTIAGEKERGTMASLLLTPVSRMAIVMGKFLALTTLSMISACIYIIALVIAMPVAMGSMMGDSQIAMTPLQVIMIAVIMLVMATFFVAIISLLAVFAKNVKEASSYISPVYILVIVSGLLTMFSTGDHKLIEYVIPVYGGALAIGQIFTNELTVLNFVVNVAGTVILTLIVARIVVIAFNNEKVMFNA